MYAANFMDELETTFPETDVLSIAVTANDRSRGGQVRMAQRALRLTRTR